MKQFIFIFLCALFLTSCSFFDATTQATVDLYPITSSSDKNTSFTVYYPDKNDNLCTKTFTSAENVPSTLTFDVYKNYPFPVFIRTSKDEKFGYIYPYSTELNQEDSFATSILLSLIVDSYNSSQEIREYLGRFNWNRFIKECRQVENPWKMDSENIKRKIANRTFTKRDLK